MKQHILVSDIKLATSGFVKPSMFFTHPKLTHIKDKPRDKLHAPESLAKLPSNEKHRQYSGFIGLSMLN